MGGAFQGPPAFMTLRGVGWIERLRVECGSPLLPSARSRKQDLVTCDLRTEETSPSFAMMAMLWEIESFQSGLASSSVIFRPRLFILNDGFRIPSYGLWTFCLHFFRFIRSIPSASRPGHTRGLPQHGVMVASYGMHSNNIRFVQEPFPGAIRLLPFPALRPFHSGRMAFPIHGTIPAEAAIP